jgi:hypothetical protein
MNTYTRDREDFLRRIVDALAPDPRFAAAWLTGSYAKGEQDAFSDIDITLVVSDEYQDTLCARPWTVSPQTTKERHDLFTAFGEPAILHENNHNAPEGGTFTFVAYAGSAVMVDWILRPLSTALRPGDSHLLWDRVGIPLQSPAEPESLETRASEASEIAAFFWMMAAVTVKYIHRRDSVFVITWLEELAKLVSEVDRRIEGRSWEYKRGSFTALAATPEEQINAVRQVCTRMENLMPQVKSMGGYVIDSPHPVIETLITRAPDHPGDL